ncbi:MAG: hypothetical protein HQL88_11030 [Magnetococcales bacterium]|nr:hypothetical protein [Magnetococcales bacterium]
MSRLTVWMMMVWLLLSASVGVAGQVGFVAHSQVSAQSQRLFGQIGLTLQGEAIQNAQVFVYTPTAPQSVLSVSQWQPEQKQTFSFDFPASHPLPGWYHLLLEIRFQDQAGVWLGSVMGVEYPFGRAERSQAKPVPTLRNSRLTWPTPPLQEMTLTVTATPHWRLEQNRLTPAAGDHLDLQLRSPDAKPLLGWRYPQLARFDWVEAGVHQSHLFPWLLHTDESGLSWHGEADGEAANALAVSWRSPYTLLLIAFGVLLLVLNRGRIGEAVRILRRR